MWRSWAICVEVLGRCRPFLFRLGHPPKIGFHTFRPTYRAWLDENGTPVGGRQKLMRHAHASTTMDQYGRFLMKCARSLRKLLERYP